MQGGEKSYERINERADSEKKRSRARKAHSGTSWRCQRSMGWLVVVAETRGDGEREALKKRREEVAPAAGAGLSKKRRDRFSGGAAAAAVRPLEGTRANAARVDRKLGPFQVI